MDHVNWWLIGLAFVLGLLLTFALTIRRVKREVPVNSSTTPAAAGGTEETATTKTPTPGEAPTTTKEAAGAGAAESKTEKSKSESEINEDARGD